MGSRISLAGKTRGNMLKLFLLSVILFSYTSAVTPTCQNLWGNQIRQEQQRNPVGEQCTFPFRTEHGINYPGADMLHPGVPTRALQAQEPGDPTSQMDSHCWYPHRRTPGLRGSTVQRRTWGSWRPPPTKYS